MDETEFNQRFAEAEPQLVGWCHLRVPPALRSRLDAEAVVQECWIRARRGCADFDPARASFSTWLIAIARNVFSESLRRVDVTRVRRDAFDSQIDAARATAGRSTLSLRGRLAREEVFVRLLESVQGLPGEEQELIARLGIERATCAQVAVSWGMSEEALSKRWQRLRERLKGTPEVQQFLGVD